MLTSSRKADIEVIEKHIVSQDPTLLETKIKERKLRFQKYSDAEQGGLCHEDFSKIMKSTKTFYIYEVKVISLILDYDSAASRQENGRQNENQAQKSSLPKSKLENLKL